MAPQKRLGELLVEAGLITPEQLQSAITHQKIAKGRMGSNLVALGYITEDVLMDFLSRQLGVPKVDARNLDIPIEVLKRIPRRMAEQYTMMPVAFREPKYLVLAMADPMDLNAIDSARFATGLNIEPMVASHSALKSVITDQYRKVQILEPNTFEVMDPNDTNAGLPVNFLFEAPAVKASPMPPVLDYPTDPFFDPDAPTAAKAPIDMGEPPMLAEYTSPGVLPERSLGVRLPRLEDLKADSIIRGLVKLLARKNVVSIDELQHTLNIMIESGERIIAKKR